MSVVNLEKKPLSLYTLKGRAFRLHFLIRTINLNHYTKIRKSLESNKGTFRSDGLWDVVCQWIEY